MPQYWVWLEAPTARHERVAAAHAAREIAKPMLKKVLHVTMATIVVLGVLVASMDPAEARRGRGWGVGVGVGLGILGLALLASPRAYGYGPGPYYGGGCHPGPRQCART